MSDSSRIARLPLFPLSQVVLFPHGRVPLHIFEQRYRRMAADVLEGERRIGMVAVPPEHGEAMSGDPPVYPVGCAGLITHVEPLRDGRYNIVLRGWRRFRILREAPRAADRPYRIAEVELLDERLEAQEAPRVAALRARLLELFGSLVRQSSEPLQLEQLTARLAELDDPAFTDGLCQALVFSTPERQSLLEEERVAERLARLTELVRFRLAELGSAGPPGSPTVH